MLSVLATRLGSTFLLNQLVYGRPNRLGLRTKAAATHLTCRGQALLPDGHPATIVKGKSMIA